MPQVTEHHLMTTNYFIFHLRFSSILTLLRNRSRTATLTYIDSTRLSRFGLGVMVKLKLFRFPIQPITQRTGTAGPKFDLYRVRDDRGRVITFDINHHLLRLRQKVLADLMPRLEDLNFIKSFQSKTMLQACIGRPISKQLNGFVFMVNYARWKFYNADGKIRNVVILPKTIFSNIVKDDFSALVDQVRFQTNFLAGFNRMFLLLKYVMRAGLGALAGRKESIEKPKSTATRLMLTYAMGIDENQRNDINFYHALNGKMAATDLLFYFRFPNLMPSEQEISWFKENNIPLFAHPHIHQLDSAFPLRKQSPAFKSLEKVFFRQFLQAVCKLMFRSRISSTWLLAEFWKLGRDVVSWKDFFQAQNVGILIHSVPSEWNFVPNLALTESGGISVSMERSILFDYCTYFHNAPNHVHFVTGSYSLSQIPEPSFSTYTIQCGAVNVRIYPDIPWIDEQKDNGKMVIAVFDELPSDWFFGNSVKELYEILVQLLEEDREDRLRMVIKTKKPEVLERLGDVNERIKELTAAGKCLFPDWKVTPAAAAAHSDLVMCVPSTAMFESALTGTRTVIYNPQKVGSSLFYGNNGLDRRIFEDKKSIVEGIQRLAGGEDDSVGDCSDLIDRIDPYNDNRGAERMGFYLLDCMEQLNNGMDRDSILTQANQTFAREWGLDKIEVETWYETHYGSITDMEGTTNQ